MTCYLITCTLVLIFSSGSLGFNQALFRLRAQPIVNFKNPRSQLGIPSSRCRHVDGNIIAGRQSNTALAFDFFGLGLPEIAVLGVLLYLLYATSRKKPGEEEEGPGRALKQDWQKARFNRIKELRFEAEDARRRRALKRMYTAMEDGEEYVLERFDQFEASKEIEEV